jgi:hypothetical protein
VPLADDHRVFWAAFLTRRLIQRAAPGELHAVPLSWTQSQPLGDGAITPGFILCRRALQLEQERPVDLLDIDRPSFTASAALASSTSLRVAAASGSARGRSVTNFMLRHYLLRLAHATALSPSGSRPNAEGGHRPHFRDGPISTEFSRPRHVGITPASGMTADIPDRQLRATQAATPMPLTCEA